MKPHHEILAMPSVSNSYAVIPSWVLLSDISDLAKVVYCAIYQCGKEFPPDGLFFASKLKRPTERVHAAIKELELVGALTSESGYCVLKNTQTIRPSAKYSDIFEAFWRQMPHRARDRSSKPQAWAAWQKIGAENSKESLDKIRIGCLRWHKSEKWAGGYAEGVHRWLLNEQYLETPLEHVEPAEVD